MTYQYDFAKIREAAKRANWNIEQVLPEDEALDFTCRFMPENLARTEALADTLSTRERLILNQIRGHEYLCIFGLVEEFILPFVEDHIEPMIDANDERLAAFVGFAEEEAKHIELFKRFHARFTAGFGTECGVIGPADAIAEKIFSHDPLAVALVTLHIEWMTQRHYLDSVRDDGALDPLFKSLLKHHWMEEAQHAKLDEIMVAMLAEGRDEAGIQKAIDGYLSIGGFLDDGMKAQAELNIAAFEAATGRTLCDEERESHTVHQHQALRWTYLGSGMTHPRFIAALERLSPIAAARIAEVAPVFC